MSYSEEGNRHATTLRSGPINFGLINIPVRLFIGSRSKTLDLDMLRKGDLIEDLKRIVEQKAKGLPVRAKGEQPKPMNVKDLMKLLKTSIVSQKKKAA